VPSSFAKGVPVETFLGMTELAVPARDHWRALMLRSEALPESARRALHRGPCESGADPRDTISAHRAS